MVWGGAQGAAPQTTNAGGAARGARRAASPEPSGRRRAPQTDEPQLKLTLDPPAHPLHQPSAAQAGGRAIDGAGRRILDVPPKSIHARMPVYLGSKEEVDRVAELLVEEGLSAA